MAHIKTKAPEALWDKWKEKFGLEQEAEHELQNAIRRAIMAKLNRLKIEVDIATAEGESTKRIKRLYAEMRLLSHNYDSPYRFSYASMDTSWRVRVIGF
jgi:hypothetical protein